MACSGKLCCCGHGVWGWRCSVRACWGGLFLTQGLPFISHHSSRTPTKLPHTAVSWSLLCHLGHSGLSFFVGPLTPLVTQPAQPFAHMFEEWRQTRGSSSSDVTAFCRTVSLVNYAPGTVIYAEHDTGDCVYLVVRGKVSVWKHGVRGRGSPTRRGACPHTRPASCYLLPAPCCCCW